MCKLHINVNSAIFKHWPSTCEPTCPAQSWVQRIRPVRGANNHHMTARQLLLLLLLLLLLQAVCCCWCCPACGGGCVCGGTTRCCCWRWHGVCCEVIHAREHLRHDAALHLTLRRLTLWRDRVDLVDEDDAGRDVNRLLQTCACAWRGVCACASHVHGVRGLPTMADTAVGKPLERHTTGGADGCKGPGPAPRPRPPPP
jgi:hypothetical protein